jgi:hypothetical protein
MWPQMVDQIFWPFAIKAAAERMNSLQIDTEGHTPKSKFYGVNIENIPVKPFTQCSVHVTFWTVDSTMRLHWTAKMGAKIKYLCINPSTGHVSPQYHVVFDNDFTTAPCLEAGTISQHCSDLLQSSSELASKQAFSLAQVWLGSTGLDNTDLQFTDNPVVDHFTIVTDQHNSSVTKNAHLDQETNNITYQKQPSTTSVLPQTIVAVSKGGTLTLGSKCSLITVDVGGGDTAL